MKRLNIWRSLVISMVLTSALKVSGPEDEEETLMKVEIVP